MTDEKLLKSVSRLGFPMFEPSDEMDVNETLAEVVKSHDTRLWEGFPVLLANAFETYQFDTSQVEKQLSSGKLKRQYHRLLLLSASVYAHYHLSFSGMNKLAKDFSNQDKQTVAAWRDALAHNVSSVWSHEKFDPERVKGLFMLYYEQKAEKDRRRKDRYEEFSLEYALSQVFSPKQKELFKKKLEGELLTKTEQEYYSRTVKKKVVALANSELHGLARKLLEH